MSMRPAVLALALMCAGEACATGKGDRMRVLDGIDQLVKARNESVDALGDIIRRPLKEDGSTPSFKVVTSRFPDDSPFAGIEVRKPLAAPLNRGLMIVDIRPSDCIGGEAIVDRYGQVDDLVAPRAFSPPGRPTDYVYHRPWGKLSFGFLDTPKGNCLSRAVIDWTQ